MGIAVRKLPEIATRAGGPIRKYSIHLLARASGRNDEYQVPAGPAGNFAPNPLSSNCHHHPQPSQMTAPHILVLAAGASRRLGQPKQLVKLAGRPALHIVVANAVAVAGHNVTVVIGAHARDLSRLLGHSPASVIINRRWEEGMASSLRFGIASLPPACDATMVLLGDQVAVTADDLKRLIDAWKGEESMIAASVYDQRVGVPAIFPRFCFSELSELRGDQGARKILERNSYRLIRVPMPNAAIDLDTPEDLAMLTERFQRPASAGQSSAAGVAGET
jgi:molybdenum cofactor cytidylyltransferase